jgi:hypothetical protein
MEENADTAHLAHQLDHGDEPASFQEATNCSDAEHWWKAMEEEIEMLAGRKT